MNELNIYSVNSSFNTYLNNCDEMKNVASKHSLKLIKSFVENHLIISIDGHLKSVITDLTKDMWNLEDTNLIDSCIGEQKLADIQESLFKTVGNYVKEIKDHSVKYYNESELEMSPLLLPEHILEVAQCISVENPLDFRLKALQCLLNSHLNEIVSEESWTFLQKILVDNLCDSNSDIFLTSMRIHAKLASCSSSIAIKESSLNMMESLSRHYFLNQNKYQIIDSENIHFFRMLHLTNLTLDTFREATLHIVRFGENNLEEMIDNFFHLLTIHPLSSKQSISPLEIVSYIDPQGKWLLNLTHFLFSRQLVFKSICKNHKFIRIIVEDILKWVNEPVIPPKNKSSVVQGELTKDVRRFAMFCHSLSVLAAVSEYNEGFTCFSIDISKKEDSMAFQNVVLKIIKLVNERRFNKMLHSTGTKAFRSFIANRISRVFNSKGIQACSLLLSVLKTDNDCSTVITQIFEAISFSKEWHQINNLLKVKCSADNFAPSPNQVMHQRDGSSKTNNEESQGTIVSLFLDFQNKDHFILDNILKHITEQIRYCDSNEFYDRIKTINTIFRKSSWLLGVSYLLRHNTVCVVVDRYKHFRNSLYYQDPNIGNKDLINSRFCAQLLVYTAASSLGFYFIQVTNMVVPLLLDGIQNPFVDWSDSFWLMFVSKASSTSEGCTVLVKERDVVIRNELTQLWNIVDDDFSDSETIVEDMLKDLYTITVSLMFSLKGVKALFIDSGHGSELTLTDESEVRPLCVYTLIQGFAFSFDNCPNFIHHQFALTVLRIITSNIDSCLYLQCKFKFTDLLLEMQSDSRVDDKSEVIIDECSLLRQEIINRCCFPSTLGIDTKPTHLMPEGVPGLTKPRSRGTGELARWLSETKTGLHDLNWLKHTQKIYKNSCSEDIRGSTVLDLLEQVVKVFSGTRKIIEWTNSATDHIELLPEEQLCIQFVLKYGTHNRILQPTKQNEDNLTLLILMVKNTLKNHSDCFEGFDWFVASAYLLCLGNLEKTQCFLSLISGLPSAHLLWTSLAEPLYLAQMGHLLEHVIGEEMPIVNRVLQSSGISWWQLCQTWTAQCWWDVLDWSQICHWFIISILHQPDCPLYFCVAMLHVNHDRLVMLGHQQACYEIVLKPVDNFQVSKVRAYIEKLQKKYHHILQPY